MIDGKLIDLPSGTTSVPIGVGSGDRLVTPRSDGSEYVELVDDCEFDFDNAISASCLVYWDRSGIKTADFSTRREMRESLPRVSPDGSSLALFIEYDQQELVILDRAPVLIDMTRTGVDDAAWASDGSLYYTRESTVFRISPNSLDDPSADQVILRIDPTVDGAAQEIAPSPDGRQLALTRITDSTLVSRDTSVWLMNSDGTDLRPFISGPNSNGDGDGTGDNLLNPVWSPDGAWILVRLKSPNVGATFFEKGLFAVRSDQANYTLSAEGNTAQQVKVQTLCFKEAVNPAAAIELRLDIAVRNDFDPTAIEAEQATICRSASPQNASSLYPPAWIQ